MIASSRLRFILSIALSFSLITFLTIDLFGQPIRSRASTGSTITVNDTGDSGTCTTTITLRCAIATANANTSTPTLINFNFNGTIPVGSVLTLTNTSQPLTIDGSGQTIVIDGGNATQIFVVYSGVPATFNMMTISHGNNTANGNGGGVFNAGTLTISSSTLSGNSASKTMGSGSGGGVSNAGTLTISSSTLSGNSASGSGGFGGFGGGVYNVGTLAINSSTLSGNSASGSGGGVVNSRTLTISNSTLSGNSASGSGGGVANSSTLTISNSTLSGNTATTGGGMFNGGPFNLISTLVAGNTGADPDIQAYTAVTSLGHNLIGDGTGSGLTNGINGDQVGSSGSPINPLLVSLASNGGPTQTLALLSGSPAIGQGDCSGNSTVTPPIPAVITDQRGVARGNPCDVGAYEGSISPTGTPTSTQTATYTPTVTNTPTSTSTPTATATNTLTSTPTNTLTNTPTATLTATPTNTSTATSTVTMTLVRAKLDTIGIYRAGTFYLRLHNSTGNADLTVAFTAGTKPYPIVGDWTGSGFDTVGVFDQNNGQFTLCTANVTASCASSANQKSLVLGVPNDQPLSGHWLLSATNAGVGVIRPSNGLIYLKNTLTTGYADYTMVLGIPGDVGLAGDWNGKGFDSPGVYRPSNSTFYLSNQVKNGSVYGDYQFAYGLGGNTPVTGDWIAQGHDGVGLFRQSDGLTYLKNLLTTGYADNTFTYGIAGDVPVAGHWQVTYPPIAPPASVLIAKTAIPVAPNGSIDGGGQIGD